MSFTALGWIDWTDAEHWEFFLEKARDPCVRVLGPRPEMVRKIMTSPAFEMGQRDFLRGRYIFDTEPINVPPSYFLLYHMGRHAMAMHRGGMHLEEAVFELCRMRNTFN